MKPSPPPPGEPSQSGEGSASIRRRRRSDLPVVEVHGDLDRALKTLKLTAARIGIFRELKERAAYRKPSERRRVKHARELARRIKAARKHEGRTGR